MKVKKVSYIFVAAAMGLLIGGSINYAIKRYGSMAISEDITELTAQSTISSSAVPSSDALSTSFSTEEEIDCSQYDITKYNCRSKATWVKESMVVEANRQGDVSFTLKKNVINLEGYAAYTRVVVDIYTPTCVKDPYSVCEKSFVMNNKPYFSEPREERFTLKIGKSSKQKDSLPEQKGSLSEKDLTDGYDYKNLPD